MLTWYSVLGEVERRFVTYDIMGSLMKVRAFKARARTILVFLLFPSTLLPQARPYEPFYTRGTKLARAGKSNEALQELERAAERAPSNPKVQNMLGVVLTQLGRLQEADKAYGAALAIAPDFFPARKNRATNAFLRRDFKLAAPEFEDLARLRPKDFVPQLFLALLAIESGDFQKARKCLLQARELAPRNGPVLLALTRVHFMLGERQLALQTTQIMEVHSDAAFGDRFDLGVLLASFRADQEATEVFERLWRAKPASYETGFDLALLQYRTGQPRAALHTVERLISRGARQPEIWDLQGLILDRLGRHDACKASLLRAIAAEPWRAEYYIDLSTILANLDDWESARRAVSEGIEKSPDKDRLYVQMGLLLQREGDLSQSEGWYRRALDANPAREAPFVGLAHLLLIANRESEAFTLLESGLQTLPNSPLLNYIYGALLQETAKPDDTSRLEQARLALERALTLDPFFANTHYRLGRIYLARGDEPRAQGHFERAYSLDPKHGQALYQLVHLLARHGQTERATVLNRALQKLQVETYTLNQELAQHTLLRSSPPELARQSNK